MLNISYEFLSIHHFIVVTQLASYRGRISVLCHVTNLQGRQTPIYPVKGMSYLFGINIKIDSYKVLVHASTTVCGQPRGSFE